MFPIDFPSLIQLASPTPTANSTAASNSQTLQTPTIDLKCVTTKESNLTVDLNGTLTLNGNPLPNFTVSISYSVNGGSSWTALTSVQTDADGGFVASWIPKALGNYLVRAEVQATPTTNPATQIIHTFTLVNPQKTEEENMFSVNSNSTVNQFNFDSENKALSFTVQGSSGTTGFVSVYIPKTVLSDLSELRTYVDGAEVPFEGKSVSDSWQISFSYPHSNHRIIMQLDTAPGSNTEYSNLQSAESIVTLSMLMISAAVIALIARKTRSC
jgi:hypothetical protein